MIRGTDFILNPDKLEEQFQLVEVSEWIDYNTKEKLGFYYTVLFPKLKFEKIKVGVKNANQLVSNEELEQRGQVTVSFEEYIHGRVFIMDAYPSKQKLPISEKPEQNSSLKGADSQCRTTS